MTLCQVTKQQCENNEQRRTYKNVKKGIKTDQRHQTTASTNWNKKRRFFLQQTMQFLYEKNEHSGRRSSETKRCDYVYTHIYIKLYSS